MIAQLARKMRLVIGLGILKMANDAKNHQRIQATLFDGEVRDNISRVQNYGHTSNPLDGAEAVLVAVGGNRNHLVAIAVDDPRYRKKGLASGEHALYHHEGDYIHFKNGRIIEVVSGTKVTITAPEIDATAATKATVTSPLVEVIATTKVTITTPDCEISGNVAIGGGLSVVGESIMQGDLTSNGTITGGAVKSAAGRDLDTLRVTGVQHGTDTSGTPV